MSESTPQVVDEDTARFTSDSQLLSELGERLIGSPDIALAELIKNSYDADATKCNIWLEQDGDELIVKDDGHGMTEDEFLNFWMTVATSNRSRQPTSRYYDREVTGSKGVGRFAVRHLGLSLELQTVAYYEERDEHLRLVADFDWEEFEAGDGLQEMEIEYRLEAGATEAEEGTTLRMTKLRNNWTQDRLENVSSEVLDIVTAPYETNRSSIGGYENDDPGFNVYFSPPGEGSPLETPASEIYARYGARVELEIDDTQLQLDYEYRNGDNRSFEFDLEKNPLGEVSGEVRFFPDQRGLFSGMSKIDGRSVRSWLGDNGGVRILDKNFRVPPYGDQGNDWLSLSESQAIRERNWRSPFTTNLDLLGSLSSAEVEDAQLRLPRKRQVLGGIHVSSSRSENHKDPQSLTGLVPAMDRQGFIQNESFELLRDIVRGSLEIMAVLDFIEEVKNAEEEAGEAEDDLKQELEQQKKQVRERIDVTPSTADDLTDSLETVEKKVDEFKEKKEEERTALESMHLVGVVSAFMSHEMNTMLESVNKMLQEWESVPKEERDEDFNQRLKKTRRAYNDLDEHLGYSKRFMRGMEDGSASDFDIDAVISEVIQQFSSFTEPRHIKIHKEIPDNIQEPQINTSLYSGVLLNLYSNAIKAVLQVPALDNGRQIRFETENEHGWHYARVADTGIGLPEGQEDKIFEPLFSTTEVDVDGPLGRGTGLGLYVVQKVIEDEGGEISVVEAPEDYETCFEVKFEL